MDRRRIHEDIEHPGGYSPRKSDYQTPEEVEELGLGYSSKPQGSLDTVHTSGYKTREEIAREAKKHGLPNIIVEEVEVKPGSERTEKKAV